MFHLIALHITSYLLIHSLTVHKGPALLPVNITVFLHPESGIPLHFHLSVSYHFVLCLLVHFHIWFLVNQVVISCFPTRTFYGTLTSLFISSYVLLAVRSTYHIFQLLVYYPQLQFPFRCLNRITNVKPNLWSNIYGRKKKKRKFTRVFYDKCIMIHLSILAINYYRLVITNKSISGSLMRYLMNFYLSYQDKNKSGLLGWQINV